MMKKRKILYISLVLLLAGCTKEADLSNTQTSEEKTPLLINATLSTGRAQTRASGKDFVSGDQLIAYIRHTVSGSKGSYTYLDQSYSNKLVTFTKGSAEMETTANDNIHQTSDLTSNAYWDDFSDPNSEGTNIRTTGHGLQPYYSYCYNGGASNISTALLVGTGVLGWTIPQNQNTATAVKNADLLWSPEQETVEYVHSTAHSANHGTLQIPFTHAMSQITVTVNAVDGFSYPPNPLASTILKLNNMHTVTTLTAPTSEWVDVPGDENVNVKTITMFGESYISNAKIRNYTAIVAPGTKLKEDDTLLEVTNADGNNYTLDITFAMLDDATGWGNGHTGDKQGTDGGKKYVVTQPGYNYHLDLTINKSAVQAHATLTGWTDVNASGTGEIVLNDDDTNLLILDDTQVPEAQRNVLVVGVDKNTFVNNSTFSLFRISNTGSYTSENNRTNTYYEFATISTFHNNDDPANDQWNNSPAIYWPNITTSYFYRALAKFNSIDDGKINISSVGTLTPLDRGTAVEQGTEAAKDILWGTTPKHRGLSATPYARSAAIPPRKGGVPIAFEHAMSKVTFNLETSTDPLSLVNLTSANIALKNIYTSATIKIEDGNMDYTSAKVEDAYSNTTISGLFVVPQTFADNAKVVITLPNESNAVYSIPLKDCVVSGGTTPITAWQRGKNYTYTIHIEKEGVQTHVLVKDWDAVAGSGTATLEW